MHSFAWPHKILSKEKKLIKKRNIKKTQTRIRVPFCTSVIDTFYSARYFRTRSAYTKFTGSVLLQSYRMSVSNRDSNDWTQRLIASNSSSSSLSSLPRSPVPGRSGLMIEYAQREMRETREREEIEREWKENWKSEEEGKQEWEKTEPQRRAFHFRRLRSGSVSTTRDVVLLSFHVAECFIRANAVTIYRGHALLMIRRHVMRRMSSAEIVDAKKRLVSFAFLESCRNEVT